MSYAALKEAIRSRFATEVATPLALAVVQENAPASPVRPLFCTLNVEIQNTQQVSTGSVASRRYRVTGRVALNLFRTIGNGDKDMLDIMDAIAVAFRGVSLSSPQVTFGAPTPSGPAVPDEAGAHYRMPAQIPFRADVIGDEE